MPTHPAKILIVDDEPFNVDYLEQELQDLGYETSSAANGVQALEMISQNAPDLVLLDIMMPLMDGFEMLKRIKATPDIQHLPVILISALDDVQNISRGIAMGAEDYLPKPFDPIVLQARLSSSLEKKRLRDQEQKYLQGLERELEIGREIQAGFLPSRLPQPPGWEVASYFKSARQVAGDFYDAFRLAGSDHLGLMLGDVSGKGVGAALYMTLFRSLLRAGANPDFFAREPTSAEHLGSEMQHMQDAQRLKGSVLLANNYIAVMHGHTSMYATLFFGLLDPSSGEFHYINAGHEPPYLLRAGKIVQRMRPTGPVIGLFEGLDYPVQAVQLEPGDLLLIYSDGILDAKNPSEEFFGEARLLPLLESSPASAAGLIDSIVSGVLAHVASSEQYDDITLLGLRRISPTPTPAPAAHNTLS